MLWYIHTTFSRAIPNDDVSRASARDDAELGHRRNDGGDHRRRGGGGRRHKDGGGHHRRDGEEDSRRDGRGRLCSAAREVSSALASCVSPSQKAQ